MIIKERQKHTLCQKSRTFFVSFRKLWVFPSDAELNCKSRGLSTPTVRTSLFVSFKLTMTWRLQFLFLFCTFSILSSFVSRKYHKSFTDHQEGKRDSFRSWMWHVGTICCLQRPIPLDVMLPRIHTLTSYTLRFTWRVSVEGRLFCPRITLTRRVSKGRGCETKSRNDLPHICGGQSASGNYLLCCKV